MEEVSVFSEFIYFVLFLKFKKNKLGFFDFYLLISLWIECLENM